MSQASTVKRVFLSSTAEDLKEHRDAVAKAIEKLGQVNIRMETFGAQPNAPVEVCKREVTKADALVVMVAHRYGWIPSAAQGGDGHKSITWLEVEARAILPTAAQGGMQRPATHVCMSGHASLGPLIGRHAEPSALQTSHVAQCDTQQRPSPAPLVGTVPLPLHLPLAQS